ncbi:MAG: glycosyltransferase family 2 protein [Acidobacteria bacterium]|nr:MAG: glycosyltransferase family 2 protein [Acidobacteriota bacterium]
MSVLFWVSAFAIVYVYAVYPALVGVWARLADRRPRKRPFPPGRWPFISIVIAARNEAARLAARVANLLEQDYPGPREIIIVSDGSIDSPGAALGPLRDCVTLIELPPGGKPLALNAGALAARGDVLVFADARQRFASGALVELIANFSDPQVGAATGELLLDCETDAPSPSTVGDGVGLYWKYEKWLRRHESRVWSTLGATGAIYALRRSLWRPLPADTLVDDVLAPMRAVLAGSRIVFDERAVAFDCAAPDAAAEARRKTRTLAGNYQILAQEPRLLLPFANPVWLQYMSHKVGRLVVPWALVTLFLASAAAAPSHWFYAVALAAQAGFYGLAALGAWMDRQQARGPGVEMTTPIGARGAR